MWAVDGAWARFQSGHSALVTLRRTPFWRGGTSDASKFHGSDGAASAPRLSIHLSRCGLAFTPFVSGCNTHRIVARHGLGRHWRPRGKRPGRASGGRPRVTRRGRHRTSPALHVTLAKREADVSLSHRCTMEHPVAPWSTTMRRVFHPERNGVKASPHRHKWMLSHGAPADPSDPWNSHAAPVSPRQTGHARGSVNRAALLSY